MKRLFSIGTIAVMVLALMIGLFAFTSGNNSKVEVDHRITLQEFESNVQNLAVFRTNNSVKFEQNSEEFALDQMRELVNNNEARKFKINYGAHFDGAVVAMPTVYNKNGEPIAVLQKGLPCPPICGIETKRISREKMVRRTY
jgi:hypothetical protein